MESNNDVWQGNNGTDKGNPIKSCSFILFPSCKGPEEVLREIFSFLDLDDLLSCEAVCVAWRSSLNERMWRNALRKMVQNIL
jgi:hypothetical protein